MTSLTLKSYQQAALDSLSAFARAAQTQGQDPALAFGALAGRPYNADAFGAQLPCVCLRIPTGGGKTVMAAHAVPLLAREWCNVDAPVAVWLVPSDAIRQRTLKALQTPGHPYRAALTAAYGETLQVCVLDDVAQIAPPDWGRSAIVVVATIQSFRIEDASQRNVYSFSESFEPHFKGAQAQDGGRSLRCLHDLPDAVVTAGDAASDSTGVLQGFVGQPRWSLANWLALHRPIVIVDEAHNTKTDKSFTALQRLNPAFILELTATPIAHQTNVLYHVSAQELAAENMIKLPIVLAEHPEGWPQAVFGAVQTQRRLEAEALKDEAAGHGYVRPIVLFQAQNTGDEMPPEALRRYLIDELQLPENQIAVATGTTRGLEDIDLAARNCPVRYVITVQALREGWDCPFAYVLCSLQKLTSATAVEQLLGRVLRMPYASRRGREALNRAYAHVCAAEFSSAAHALTDRLIGHMGFEALDVASMIAAPAAYPLFGDDFESNQPLALIPPAVIATNFEAVSASPALLALPGVQLQTIAGTEQVVVTGHIPLATETQLLAQVRGPKKQQQVREQVARSIESHVGDLRDVAAQQQFRQRVLQPGDAGAWLVEPDWTRPHVFDSTSYPAPVASRYSGRYQFPKHYFSVLADLKDNGQEFQCAQLIDRHPSVAQWIRNLDTAPCGFALPTSRGRFFADFVAQLVDGRVAVLEFKGAHLVNDPYEIEKSQVGALWAQASAGRAVFGWLTMERHGQDMAQQLDALLQ